MKALTNSPKCLAERKRLLSLAFSPESSPKSVRGSTGRRFSLSFVESNKDTTKSKLKERMCHLKTLAKRRDIRISVAKQAKNFIYTDTKMRKQERLADKFRKFAIISNQSESSSAKKSWVVLSTVCGFLHVLKKKSENRKKLQKRIDFYLRWFVQISKCVGRIRTIRDNNKYRRALFIFRVHLVYRIHRYVKEFKTKYKQRVDKTIEAFFTQNSLFTMFYRFRIKFLHCQRSMVSYLRAKRIMYNDLLNKWNLMEREISRSHKKQTDYMRKNSLRATVLGTSTIPEEVKVNYMREHFKQQVKSYHESCVEYYKRLNAIKSLSFEEKLSQDLLTSDYHLKKPLRPSMPLAKHVFDPKTLKELILTAMNERSIWSRTF